jgi:hypothetical protein
MTPEQRQELDQLYKEATEYRTLARRCKHRYPELYLSIKEAIKKMKRLKKLDTLK